VAVSLAAHYATAAAADQEHQRLVSALVTGPMPKEARIR
jgi:hypothetical protein